MNPTSINANMQYNDLLSLRATCRAIFPLSEFFNALEISIDIIAVDTKSRPYAACAINELKFSATNIVRYGSNDKINNDIAVNQITSRVTLFTMLNKLLL